MKKYNVIVSPCIGGDKSCLYVVDICTGHIVDGYDFHEKANSIIDNLVINTTPSGRIATNDFMKLVFINNENPYIVLEHEYKSQPAFKPYIKGYSFDCPLCGQIKHELTEDEFVKAVRAMFVAKDCNEKEIPFLELRWNTDEIKES